MEETNNKINQIKKTMSELRATMNLNSVRQYNIQKIIKIINHYNNNIQGREWEGF